MQKDNDAGELFLDFIRGKPCIVCGMPGDPHHYGKEGKGIALKCSDLEVVPLCNDHHIEDLHRFGQKNFEKNHGISLVEWNGYYRELFEQEYEITLEGSY